MLLSCWIWIILSQVTYFVKVSSTQEISASNPVKYVSDYLTLFGYLDAGHAGKEKPTIGNRFLSNPTNSMEHEKFSTAIKNFQWFFGLPVTGQVDNATMSLMSRPRCGNYENLQDQVIITPRRKRRYAASKYVWTKQNLTYRVSHLPTSGNGNKLSHVEQRRIRDLIEGELAYAFALWGDVVNLNFFKAQKESKHVDIDIKFVEGAHGDDYAFDGAGLMIAHAFLPNPGNQFAGDIHFDNDETWIIGASPADEQDVFNFRWGAIHEIGHALGLEHSNVEDAYMYPIYPSDPYDPNKPLHADDIIGIEALYSNTNVNVHPSTARPEYKELEPVTRTPMPEVETTIHPTTREQYYNTNKLKEFTNGLVEIVYALNPTSPDGSLLACKLVKHSNGRQQHLCLPDRFLF